MNRPAISEPKSFQVRTAEAALAAFAHNGGPRRFLIADEVGLGKTVVARTVVREMMKRRRAPLVVFYVASNLTIAHQNRRKLLEAVSDDSDAPQAAASADRLTLAADPDLRPTHKNLHLYTLTPDTSVPLHRASGGAGRVQERALIYRLLAGRFPSLARGAFEMLCRGKQVTLQTWRAAQSQYKTITGIQKLQEAFWVALRKDEVLKVTQTGAGALTQLIQDHKRSQLLGRFRNALALAALDQIRPDLIIFDEFQKFRSLLIDTSQSTKFDAVTETLRGGLKASDPAILLLSATPYRMYSSRREELSGPSHYQEFVELIRFLLGEDPKQSKGVEQNFRDFGIEMQSPAPNESRLNELKREIERHLRPVMSRTERIQPDGVRAEIVPAARPGTIDHEDLRVFKDWVLRLRDAKGSKAARHVDLLSFAVPYWFSVPLPVQMLGWGYVAWRDIDSTLKRGEPGLRQADRDRLRAPKIWPHPQLRALKELIPVKRLALPWVTPSLPWWDLRRGWADPAAAGGKLLVFSRFKAVPPTLAALLSFGLEAEGPRRGRNSYEKAGHAQPLQLTAKRLALVALFFPAPTLIVNLDPRGGNPGSLTEARLAMRQQLRKLLRDLGIHISRSGASRPLWVLLGGLERAREAASRNEQLPDWSAIRKAWMRAAGPAAGQREIMADLMDRWRHETSVLREVSQRELAALAEFALAGPGVVLGRALCRFDATACYQDAFSGLVEASWNGLRAFLNKSWFRDALAKRGQNYTDAILEAVVDGNLESVLDEHLWITGQLDPRSLSSFAKDLKQVLGLRAGRQRVFESKHKEFSLRCHAALQFSNAQVDGSGIGKDERLRTDDLRRAFNTPFWPHALITTSLGQEGLDFHVWCRQLLHWDLCPSPLELEQREGRIQRFGGLFCPFSVGYEAEIKGSR